MLFEMAYPVLFLREAVLRATKANTHARRTDFAFRAFRSRMRHAEIEILSAVLPSMAGRLALSRFERSRPSAPRSRERWYRHGKLAETLAGPPGGPRVLLVHGWNADSAMMVPLAESLAAKGVRVVLPDLPGEGANARRAMGLAEKAARLAANYRGEEPFEAVVGHSAGGIVAAMSLERGLPASRLVTVCSPFSMATLLEAYLTKTCAPDGLFREVTRIYERRENRSPEDIGPRAYQTFGDRLLVAHAVADWQVKIAEAHQICASAPNARKLLLGGCNHRTVLAHPELHEAITAFIGAKSGEAAKC